MLNRKAGIPAPISKPLAALLIGCFLTLGTGCKDRAPTSPTSQVPPRPADATYTTRGKVETFPEKGKTTSSLSVYHEPVNTFFDPRVGKVTGMSSMTMPFPLIAPGVALEQVAVGDAVELTFGVWYKPDPLDAAKKVIDTFAVQKLVKLPPGTELKFGVASPPLGGP